MTTDLDPAALVEATPAKPWGNPELTGWDFWFESLNMEVGVPAASEAEARTLVLEHVKAALGLPTLAEIAAAWTTVRATRDRWLALTDYVEGFLTAPAAFAYLPQSVRDAIGVNAEVWTTWRQTLRDLPATLDDDGAVKLAGDVPAAWPQPPISPVVLLT